jgi:hypothetical protein
VGSSPTASTILRTVCMNIYDPKHAPVIKAIKFCLNYHPANMRILGVDYKESRELYKCRVLDHEFGGRVTVYLEEKFVRHAINWLNQGGMAEWLKASVLKTEGGNTSGSSNLPPSST